jgi:prepilin-type processing-associated H-X9-DG protein
MLVWLLLCLVGLVLLLIASRRSPREIARALAVIAIVGALLFTLAGFAIVGIGSSHALARRNQCQHKCQEIQAAIHEFAAANRRLPYLVTTLPEAPSGPTEYVTAGWVPQILAFLDRNRDLYAIYESNAHSATLGTPYNYDGTQEGPPGYMFIQDAYLVCPDSNEVEILWPATVAGGPASAPTSYAVNAGFPDQTADTSQPLDYQENGVFFDQAHAFAGGYPPAPKTDLAYIAKHDGTATTILLSENLDASYWAQYNGHPEAPVSFAPREGPAENISYESPDGLVWFDYSDGTKPAIGLNKDYNGGRGGDPAVAYEPRTILPPTHFARPSSSHSGGFNITFCDGHTLFMNEDVAYQVYAELMTPRGSHARPAGSGPYVAGSNPSAALQTWQGTPIPVEALSQ